MHMQGLMFSRFPACSAYSRINTVPQNSFALLSNRTETFISRLVGSTKTNNSVGQLKKRKTETNHMSMNRAGSMRPRLSYFSQIDESALYINSAVFVVVEICTTAK